jgi:hypothetical protein
MKTYTIYTQCDDSGVYDRDTQLVCIVPEAQERQAGKQGEHSNNPATESRSSTGGS